MVSHRLDAMPATGFVTLGRTAPSEESSVGAPSTVPSVKATVLIAAHDRKQYLRPCVESVLAQDIPRSEYEIVVVKNFDDPDIDGFLNRTGVRAVRCDDIPVGQKLAAGLRHSSGEIVFLLDDDDLFSPSKLRTVLSRFSADTNLGFYHNRFRYIGPDGKPLSRRAVRPFALRRLNGSRPVYLDSSAKEQELHRLAYCYADFNISSIAFRRELATDSYTYLNRLSGALDTFLFFHALLSPYSLLIDDMVLTDYRVHDTNMTLAAGPDAEHRRSRLLGVASVLDRSYVQIKEMTMRSSRSHIDRQIDARLLVNRLTQVFRESRSRRMDAVKVLFAAARLRDTYAVRENVVSWAGAILFSIWPTLARRVYFRQLSI